MVGFADETVVGGGETVGARLRRAREAHGLSLDEICERTRVPTRHLRSIEEDAYDQLPAAPYSVGFAKAFADAVGLNREEIGREFRAEKEGYGASDLLPVHVREESESGGSGGRWILLIVVAIAIIGFGLWWGGVFGGANRVEAPAANSTPATPPAAPSPAAGPQAPAPMISPPVTNEAGPAPEESSSGKKNASEAKSSPEKSGSSEKKGASGKKAERSTGSTTTKRESDETSHGTKSPDNGSGGASSSSTGTTETSKPAIPTTRDLNIQAQKRLAPAAAPAAPPVIAPPPPAPAASPAPTAPNP
jgi:cytoskeletal protein RodZ